MRRAGSDITRLLRERNASKPLDSSSHYLGESGVMGDGSDFLAIQPGGSDASMQVHRTLTQPEITRADPMQVVSVIHKLRVAPIYKCTYTLAAFIPEDMMVWTKSWT